MEILFILIIMATVFAVLTFVLGNTILILADFVEMIISFIKDKNNRVGQTNEMGI